MSCQPAGGPQTPRGLLPACASRLGESITGPNHRRPRRGGGEQQHNLNPQVATLSESAATAAVLSDSSPTGAARRPVEPSRRSASAGRTAESRRDSDSESPSCSAGMSRSNQTGRGSLAPGQLSECPAARPGCGPAGRRSNSEPNCN